MAEVPAAAGQPAVSLAVAEAKAARVPHQAWATGRLCNTRTPHEYLGKHQTVGLHSRWCLHVCRAGSTSARSTADSLGSARPQTPAQRMSVPQASAGTVPRLALSGKATDSATGGRPPSSRRASNRAGNR